MTFEIEYWNADKATRTVLVDLKHGVDLAATLKTQDKRFQKVKRGRAGKGCAWLTPEQLLRFTAEETA